MAKTKTGPDAVRPAPPATVPVHIEPGVFKLRPAASLPPREWLYGRDFIRKFVTVTVAAGGTGKTLLTVGEALAMATGRPLLGTASARPLRVWTVNGEDPLDEMERRFAAAAQHYGLTAEDIGDRLFLNSGQDRRLIITDPTKKGIHILGPVMVNLERRIKALKIDVLIVDPFVSCHHLNENDNAAIDAVAKTWGRLANRTGCAVHLVHHTRKTSGSEATVEDGRGASALLAAARVGRVLNPMTKDEADRAGLSSAAGYFRMSYGKTSLCRLTEDATWLRLVGTDLGNGLAGSPGDDVGVVTTWTWPDTPASVEADQVALIHQALSDGDWRESPQAQRWAGRAIADALGLTLPEDTPKVKGLIKTLLGSGHLATLEGHDSKRMARTFLVPATPGEHEVWQGVASEAE